MNIFERRESQVRSYCRSFPVTFDRAKMEMLYTADGREYLDFFAGAGAINYGHNNEYIKKPILDYIARDGLMHALDMFTVAKQEFLETFERLILEPRGLDYRVMCCGPTGTNAVEAALKLCRKVKQNEQVYAFTGSFHGMTMGSLSLSSGKTIRAGGSARLDGVAFMPHPKGNGRGFDTIEYIENVMTDEYSGVNKPAAIFVETVQAEGGVVVADAGWLRELRELCDRQGVLLVCDDIQVGCGRTGGFFSFERAGIVPDLVTLSKSISGYGLPMSLLLIRPELDIWKPAEHNGTFRGNQIAFVGAKAALEYREAVGLQAATERKGQIVHDFVTTNILPLCPGLELRGLGLIQGIDFSKTPVENAAGKVQAECFKNGLIIERAGRDDCVLKIMPPLVITEENLLKGLEIIRSAAAGVLGGK